MEQLLISIDRDPLGISAIFNYTTELSSLFYMNIPVRALLTEFLERVMVSMILLHIFNRFVTCNDAPHFVAFYLKDEEKLTAVNFLALTRI